MKIGQLSEQTGVSTRTIRYYESIGLLPPVSRTPSGYRSYDADAVERLRFVRDAQATGLTLTEIASVLELKDAGARTCEHTRNLLRQHLAEVDERISQLTATRQRLEELADRAEALDPAACVDPHRCQVIVNRARPQPVP